MRGSLSTRPLRDGMHKVQAKCKLDRLRRARREIIGSAKDRTGSSRKRRVSARTGRTEQPVTNETRPRLPPKEQTQEQRVSARRTWTAPSSGSWMPARAPVTNPDALRCERARHRAPSAHRKNGTEGSPEGSKDRSDHALVRVGSAAMPAPFAFLGLVWPNSA